MRNKIDTIVDDYYKSKYVKGEGFINIEDEKCEDN